MQILTTVLLGLGTVFFGLVCIIVMIEIMHFLITKFTRTKTEAEVTLPSEVEEINHGVLVALIATTVAENMGKDVSAIRINSIKKIH